MAIKIKCRKCDAKFSVKDAAAGRRVKCRQCGVPIKVPVPKTDEEELLNFDAAAYDDDPGTVAGRDTMPPRAKKKKKLSSSGESSASGWKSMLDPEKPVVWVVAPTSIALVVFFTTAINLTVGYGFYLLFALPASLVVFFTFWMLVIRAFGESWLKGLLCLFTPYFFYWVATEWYDTKKTFRVMGFAILLLFTSELALEAAVRAWFTEAVLELAKESAARPGANGLVREDADNEANNDDVTQPEKEGTKFSTADEQQTITEFRSLGVRFSPNRKLAGTNVDFGLIRGGFPNDKLALLKSLPKVLPPVSIRLPEGVTDQGLSHLIGLDRLHELSILGNNVTDAGLRHVEKIKSLKQVVILSNKVTPEGIQRLKQALPNCEIKQMTGG
ncbi:MAG TPA: hypothetical protein EYQ63_00230 [Fuerstia sp.]|nr:hypothetical protein [Fuerstiella sp.]